MGIEIGTLWRLGPWRLLPELCFGGAIVAVALAQSPTLLLLPTTVLFAGKFLLSPFLHPCLFERGGQRRRRRHNGWRPKFRHR
jgi:hypothetical protein